MTRNGVGESKRELIPNLGPILNVISLSRVIPERPTWVRHIENNWEANRGPPQLWQSNPQTI